MDLWSKKMGEGKGSRISKLHESDREDPEQNLGALQDTLRIFRDSLHAAAERPDFFWKIQHKTIMARLGEPAPPARYRSGFLWVPVAAVVLLCLFFLVENSKAPTPDIAAGSDQNLLIEVERALNQDCPDALAPAAILSQEIEKADKNTVQAPTTK